MKRILLLAALTTILIPVAAYSQEDAAGAAQKQNAARTREMQMREKELDLQQKEAELKFQQQKRELELQSRKVDLENARKPKQNGMGVILILILIVNILCSVWVYQDIQKKSHESGIWIIIALLAGLIGTLVYAVIRIGDVSKQKV
jgi:Flp pilus assembly protein TadB